MSRDPHQALKTEVISKTRSAQAEFVLAKLQWSKTEVGYSAHAAPNSFSTAGFQSTDYLALLGFQRSGCSFVDRGECYTRWVNENFDLERFSTSFDQGLADLLLAQRQLEQCGFFLEQSEGWGYFFGKARRGARSDISMQGDGHTAMKIQSMKRSDDENFAYHFTWLESAGEKGWVIHYRPKHPPLSAELSGVFRFLSLRQAAECPEFEFESCHWRSIAFESRGDGFFDSNATMAHGWFDAHATSFSPAIEKLLASNRSAEEFGFGFLRLETAANRLESDLERKVVRPRKPRKPVAGHDFDVAISFAGTERRYAETLAKAVESAGYSVFYDDFYPEALWGKDLVETFDEIFRKRARYCVMFISQEYVARMWTTHERRSAQARAVAEKGEAYILPIRVDDTEVPGMPPTVGYIPISKGIEEIGRLLIEKLK